jgi:putative transposase
MSERIDQQLVLDALKMALGQCRPQAGLIHHTDQGRQYSRTAYGNIRCLRCGTVCFGGFQNGTRRDP